MMRVSFSTAFASLLVFCGVGDALCATKSERKLQLRESEGIVGCQASAIHGKNDPMGISDSIFIGGALMSNGWIARENDYHHREGKESVYFSSDYSRQYGLSQNGMLYIGIGGRNDDFEISYGAKVELDFPHVDKGEYVSFKQVNNRGAGVFVNTSFGNLHLGYQMGVDTMMRVDGFSVSAGDKSNLWMGYVNLRGLRQLLPHGGNWVPITMREQYLDNVFYLSTGLYSEGLADGGSRFSRHNAPSGVGYKSLVNSLPFRMSYVSPNFGGMSFAVSYAPLGYNEHDVVKANVESELVAEKSAVRRGEVLISNFTMSAVRKRGGGRIARGSISLPVHRINQTSQLIIPVYDHVVNVAMTYKARVEDVDFKASITTEYARNKTAMLSERVAFPKMGNIKGVAFGGMLGYKGMKLAASYGYLGKIDCVHGMYTWKDGKFQLESADSVLINAGDTYFWTAGAGYEYDGFALSAVYHGSNYSENKLGAVNLGAEYDLSDNSSRVRYKVFANYHHFVADSSRSFKKTNGDDKNKGNVFLAGMEVRF